MGPEVQGLGIPMSEFKNLFLLAADALIYFIVLAALFRARGWLGIGAFFCALGVMHFLETYLASSFYVALPLGIVASPGSTVLFTGKLMLLLLVYIREDAVTVRQPIYGLLIGNLLLLALAAVIRNHELVQFAPGRAIDLGFLDEMGALMVWGTAILFVDCILLILLYERSRAWFGGLMLARLAFAGRRCTDVRSGAVLRRVACCHRRGSRRAVRWMGREDGSGCALQRTGHRLPALVRAADRCGTARTAHRRRVRYADLSRTLRRPAGAHRARRTDRRARSWPARSSRGDR